MARARIEPIVHLTLSEAEAKETIRLLLEGVEDPEGDEPGARVARTMVQAMGVKIRVTEQVPIVQPAPKAEESAPRQPAARRGRPPQGQRKGRVAGDGDGA